MRASVKVTGFVVAVIAAAAVYLSAWSPYRQNLIKARVNGELAMVIEREAELGARRYQREAILRNAERWLVGAIDRAPTDAVLRMQLSAVQLALGRRTDAVAQYEQLIRHHRRPEIFSALAREQLMIGRIEDAVTNFAYASAFHPANILAVPEALRPRTRERVRELYGSDVAADVARY